MKRSRPKSWGTKSYRRQVQRKRTKANRARLFR